MNWRNYAIERAATAEPQVTRMWIQLGKHGARHDEACQRPLVDTGPQSR